MCFEQEFMKFKGDFVPLFCKDQLINLLNGGYVTDVKWA
jgi:hypothetical protein